MTYVWIDDCENINQNRGDSLFIDD